MMFGFRLKAISMLVLIASAVGGCQSTPASNCAGFTLNNLSPAGTVALIQADRTAWNRVEANDRNYERACKGA